MIFCKKTLTSAGNLNFLQITCRHTIFVGFFANRPAHVAKISFVLPETGRNFDTKDEKKIATGHFAVHHAVLFRSAD